jgi:hypothetical protein
MNSKLKSMIFLCLDIVYDPFSLRLDFSLLYTKKGNGIGWFQQCTLFLREGMEKIGGDCL